MLNVIRQTRLPRLQHYAVDGAASMLRKHNSRYATSFVMEEITGTSEVKVDDVLTAERGLLFISVAWSGYVAQSAAVVDAAITRWNDNPANDRLKVFSIDLSDQQGPLWDTVTNWLTSQGVDDQLRISIMYGGSGALLWILDGQMTQYSTYPAHDGVDSLLGNTRSRVGQSAV